MWTLAWNEQWSWGCQSSVYAIVLNGTELIRLFITGTTSAPSCFAGQFFNDKDPFMKSFCTSTIRRAEWGNKT